MEKDQRQSLRRAPGVTVESDGKVLNVRKFDDGEVLVSLATKKKLSRFMVTSSDDVDRLTAELIKGRRERPDLPRAFSSEGAAKLVELDAAFGEGRRR